MTKQLEINCGALLTIRRPSGAIETVEFTRASTLTPRNFADIQKATKAAGKGDVLSWSQMTKLVDAPQPTAADRAEAFSRQVARVSATGRA